jgi:NADH-quinone oxidoreductase subunit L
VNDLFDWLFVLPTLPFASFVLLSLVGRWLPRRRVVAAIGVGSMATVALLAVALAVRFLSAPPPDDVYVQHLWRWIEVGGFNAEIALLLDPLSLVMVLVVTVVGFLIHLFAAQFMLEERKADYTRFFCGMNLFVSAMLVLVLADDLVLLLLGWEGVGLCSYLLIGFWYQDPKNGAAARKAFVVTRIGDVALLVGLLVLYRELGTADIGELMERATAQWSVGAGVATLSAALLLGGAVGKSAQLPLQTWLPDAMAGPTPVSALIHAATMVTAGVYLVARTHELFLLAPAVLQVVAYLGAATLLVAGFAALVQRDIKRVLAYSTMSQLGFMFLALGVGAWAAAAFHLMTHAFFKSLLFLGAGAVSMALHHEYDITKMGGLRRDLRITFVVFVIAGASLAGFPLFTAGFYSKDNLLWAVWASERGSFWLWAAGIFGAFLTALYIFRLIFLVFFGEARSEVHEVPGLRLKVPLIVLAALSLLGGFVELPKTLGNLPFFSELLARTLHGDEPAHASLTSEAALQGVAGATTLLGIYVAYRWYIRRPRPAHGLQDLPGVPERLERFWLGGWGFDELYRRLFVRPYVAAAEATAHDPVDLPYRWLADLTQLGHRALRATQTGKLRWYAAALAAGVVAMIALELWVLLP